MQVVHLHRLVRIMMLRVNGLAAEDRFDGARGEQAVREDG